jgi:hypothetical protein
MPNYIYNVPHEIHEYLSFGLKFICDCGLKMTIELIDKNIYYIELDSLVDRLIKINMF